MPHTGTVVLQWYRQDGYWQVPSSWSCHGAFPPEGTLTPDSLSKLPPRHPYVSALYVLVAPTDLATPVVQGDHEPAAAAAPLVLLGELVVSLERAKSVQLQVCYDNGTITAQPVFCVGVQSNIVTQAVFDSLS